MAFLLPLAATAGAAGGTAATLGTVASLAGTAFSVLGALGQGQAQAAAAKSNAVVARQHAQEAAREGEIKAEADSQKTRAQAAGILANQGASGVDVNSKSSVDVRSSAAELGELSAINIRANAAREAYGYQTEANNFSSEAKNDRMASYIGAGSTLLGGLGNASTNYATYQQNASLGTV